MLRWDGAAAFDGTEPGLTAKLWVPAPATQLLFRAKSTEFVAIFIAFEVQSVTRFVQICGASDPTSTHWVPPGIARTATPSPWIPTLSVPTQASKSPV